MCLHSHPTMNFDGGQLTLLCGSSAEIALIEAKLFIDLPATYSDSSLLFKFNAAAQNKNPNGKAPDKSGVGKTERNHKHIQSHIYPGFNHFSSIALYL